MDMRKATEGLRIFDVRETERELRVTTNESLKLPKERKDLQRVLLHNTTRGMRIGAGPQ
jgi:hypothetical protein